MAVPIVIGVGVAILLVFFFLGGRLTESNERSTSTPTPIGSNENSGECVDLCNQWDQRRQERCLAESAAQASQRKVNNLRIDLAIAIGAATALGVAAYLASLIPPPFGVVAAIVLGVAAAAALLAADFIAGKLTIAAEELSAAEMNASKARNSEAEARTLLITNCPEQSNTCLSRPSPC